MSNQDIKQTPTTRNSTRQKNKLIELAQSNYDTLFENYHMVERRKLWEGIAPQLNELAPTKTIRKRERCCSDMKPIISKEIEVEKAKKIQRMEEISHIMAKHEPGKNINARMERVSEVIVKQEPIENINARMERVSEVIVKQEPIENIDARMERVSEVIVNASVQTLCPRPTARQKKRLIELVELNYAMIYDNTASGADLRRQIWENVASELNTLGPQKTTKQWRRCWADMKFGAKKKLKQNQESEKIQTVEEICQMEIECSSSNKKVYQVSKPTFAQKLRMIDQIEFNYNELYGPGIVHDKNLRHQIWEEMAEELNKLGPNKNVKQWQRCWADIRSSIKRKMKDMKQKGIKEEHLLLYFSNEEERIIHLFDIKCDDDQSTDDEGFIALKTSESGIKTEIVEISDIIEIPVKVEKVAPEVCDSFGKNVAEQMKCLSESKAFDVMKEIQDILYQYQKQGISK